MRSLLVTALILLPATPALAAPSPEGEITIESPAGVATGVVAVRIQVSGGFRDAEQAAFHVRESGDWNEERRVDLTPLGGGVFEGSWDSSELANGVYRLEVRAWGEVPPYDPAERSTFAGTTADLTVDNAPPPPDVLQGVSPASGIRIGWSAVPTSDRSDFLGYRLFVARGSECPGEPSAYRAVADVADPLYTDDAASPGRYCLRVASLRASAVSGTVESQPSGIIAIKVVAGSAGIPSTTGQPQPPPPPPLGEGELEVSDGSFGEDLPYGPATVTEEVTRRGGDEDASIREAGSDPKRTPTLVAFGLVLGVGALLIRRFLATPRSA